MSGDTMDFYQARLDLLKETSEQQAEIARLRKELATMTELRKGERAKCESYDDENAALRVKLDSVTRRAEKAETDGREMYELLEFVCAELPGSTGPRLTALGKWHDIRTRAERGEVSRADKLTALMDAVRIILMPDQYTRENRDKATAAYVELKSAIASGDVVVLCGKRFGFGCPDNAGAVCMLTCEMCVDTNCPKQPTSVSDTVGDSGIDPNSCSHCGGSGKLIGGVL